MHANKREGEPSGDVNHQPSLKLWPDRRMTRIYTDEANTWEFEQKATKGTKWLAGSGRKQNVGDGWSIDRVPGRTLLAGVRSRTNERDGGNRGEMAKIQATFSHNLCQK